MLRFNRGAAPVATCFSGLVSPSVRSHYSGGNPNWRQDLDPKKRNAWGGQQKYKAETVQGISAGWYTATSSHVHSPGGGVKWKDRNPQKRNNNHKHHGHEQFSTVGPLFEAAKAGWVEVLRAFLEGADSPEEREKLASSRDEENRQSLVHYGAQCTNDNAGRVMEMLNVEYGQALTGTDVQGRTPLHVAAEAGSIPAVRYLLANTPLLVTDVSAENGRSSLHLASMTAHADCFEELLNSCKDGTLDINSSCHEDWTCLHSACGRKGSLKIVKLLLERGARVNVKNSGGWCPIHIACHYGHSEFVKLLLDAGCDVEAVTDRGDTALHHAVHSQDLATVQLLFAAGAQVEALNAGGWSPLHAVTQNGCDLQVLGVVLDAAEAQGKMDLLNSITVEGWTVLKLLSFYGRLEACQVVVARGSPVNLAPGMFSPLHSASCSGCLEIVHFLVESKADLNALNPNDWTPLHCAIDAGHEDCAQLLLRCGADPFRKTNQGMTAVHFAARKGFCDTIQAVAAVSEEALSTTNGLGWTPLHVAAYWNQATTIATLLQLGASPDCHATNGFTPLHVAVEPENEAVIWNLVQFGVPLNAVDDFGRTALIVAVRKNRLRSVSLLVQLEGLDTELADRFGTRAIDHAVLKELPEIKRALEWAGSPPSALEKNHGLATGEHHLEVHRLLRQSRLKNKFIKVFQLHTVALEQYRVPQPYYTARWEVAEWIHIIFGDEQTVCRHGTGGAEWGAGSALRVADGEAWVERCRSLTNLLLFSVDCERGSAGWQHLVRLSQLNRRSVKSTATIDHLMDQPMSEGLVQFHSEVVQQKFFPLRDLLEDLDLRLEIFLDFQKAAEGNTDEFLFIGTASCRCLWSGETRLSTKQTSSKTMLTLCSILRQEVSVDLEALEAKDSLP